MVHGVLDFARVRLCRGTRVRPSVCHVDRIQNPTLSLNWSRQRCHGHELGSDHPSRLRGTLERGRVVQIAPAVLASETPASRTAHPHAAPGPAASNRCATSRPSRVARATYIGIVA